MNILTEIHRSQGLHIDGRTLHRTAVRGVILRGKNLLMVHSSAVGDYKFPGGGVAQDESHQQALAREINEECGATLAYFGGGIGAVVEYSLPMETGFDVFKMTSYYYRCDVTDDFGSQKLDDYEKDLGFKPLWVGFEEALQNNKAVLNSKHLPEWLNREIFILEYIKGRFFSE